MRKSTHVLVIPYPAQGHIIPLLELSRRLVLQGLKVTFVVTNFSHGKVKDQEKSTTVKMAAIEDGLGKDERERPGRLSEWVLKGMPRKIEELIDEINGGDEEMMVGCVVADHTLGWAMDIAEKKGIKKAAFFPAAAANMAPRFSIPNLIHRGIIDGDGMVLRKETIKESPEMPSLATSNLAWTNFTNPQMRKWVFNLMRNNNVSTQKADRLICNSTYHLEPAALKLVPLIPVGPLLSNYRDLADSNASSLRWLDRQLPHSVIYVAFGSFAVLGSPQIRELALGLELSKRPFLWVKNAPSDDDRSRGKGVDFPSGFLERVGERGRVVSEWVPQQRVLSHSSVACFVSHCGWNSTVEGVANGLSFVCWPCYGDQFLNRSYLCDVWRVGLGLESDEVSGLVVKEEIRDKLERVFGDGEMRERSLALKEKLVGCIGSIQNYMALVEWINS